MSPTEVHPLPAASAAQLDGAPDRDGLDAFHG